MTTQRDRDMTVPRGRRAHAGLPADETPQRPALASAVSDRGPVPHLRPGPRLVLRPKSVRAKIVSVLMVPVVSLMALWAFAAVTTAQEVSGQLRAQRVDRTIRQPVTATVTALQAERHAAARYLAAPSTARADELERRVDDTERAAAPLRLDRTHTVADGTGLSAQVTGRVRTFVDGVTALTSLRPRITARAARWEEAYADYNAAVEKAFAVAGALAATPPTGSPSTSPGPPNSSPPRTPCCPPRRPAATSPPTAAATSPARSAAACSSCAPRPPTCAAPTGRPGTGSAARARTRTCAPWRSGWPRPRPAGSPRRRCRPTSGSRSPPRC